MKEAIRAMKAALKQVAAEIREKKGQRKGSEFGYVPGLFDAQRTFRHMHIVYCLLRGRTLTEIEPKVRPENGRNELLLQRYWLGATGLHYTQRPEVESDFRMLSAAQSG